MGSTVGAALRGLLVGRMVTMGSVQVWLRLPFQLVLIAWALWVSRARMVAR